MAFTHWTIGDPVPQGFTWSLPLRVGRLRRAPIRPLRCHDSVPRVLLTPARSAPNVTVSATAVVPGRLRSGVMGAFIAWCGRIILWAVWAPLGVLASLGQGGRKRTEKQITAAIKAQGPQLPPGAGYAPGGWGPQPGWGGYPGARDAVAQAGMQVDVEAWERTSLLPVPPPPPGPPDQTPPPPPPGLSPGATPF